MFAVVTFPISDFRHLVSDELGRLEKPRWGRTDPDALFLRGFGPIHRRTKSGIGFSGEEFYADCDKLLSYPDPLVVHPFKDSNEPVPFYPIYRRFYFDGYFAGKMELGFRAAEEVVKHYSDLGESYKYAPETIAEQLLKREIALSLLDGRRFVLPLTNCRSELVQAYLLASTKSKEVVARDILTIGPSYVKIAEPFVFLRTTNETPIASHARRRELSSYGSSNTFLSRSNNKIPNFNLVIQESSNGVEDESKEERAIRLSYCQMRLLVQAQATFLLNHCEKTTAPNNLLIPALEAILSRLGELREDGSGSTSEAKAARKEVIRGENVDVSNITKNLEVLLESLKSSRSGTGLAAYIDKKVDKVIEASTTTATNYVLKGGL